MFLGVRRASGPIFIFCALGLIFGGTEGTGSHFYVLHNRRRFPWYRGHRVPLSCFPLSDSFSAVPRASGPIFFFCAPELVFSGTEGVGSNFHILRFWTHFRRYRGRRVPFPYFARPDSFLAALRASDPVIMFYAPGLVFGGTEGVRSHSNTESFPAVPRAPYSIFFFCAQGLIFSGTEGVGSSFHVLRSRTRFRRNEGVWSHFHVLRSRLVFGGTKGSGSRFHILRSRARSRRYGGRRVSISCIAQPDSF
jgi:hypothetical protein